MPKRKIKRTPQQLAEFVAEVLDDLKAERIERLDVTHLTSITDMMVIASGRSDRHVRAMAETLVEKCEEAGYEPLGIEGRESGEWVLVDLGDVVVHVMLPRARAFYDIEKLWDISKPREAVQS
jgi:ribosome-associated protein